MNERNTTKKLDKNWSLTNNGNSKDNEMFYEIVKLTMNEKISENEFYKVVKRKQITSYKRYEDLYGFAKYLNK
jgi:hypothetical protein